jgi:hypothetical protein
MTHIKDNHFSGLCTRRLVLYRLKQLDMDIVELSTLCPNLRSLTLIYSGIKTYSSSTNEETLLPFKKWLRQLEYINEAYMSSIINDLIYRQYRFDRLVSPSICGDRSFPDPETIPCLHHLNNAPVLKSLKLIYFHIAFDDIKALHEDAPLITTLKMVDIEFLPTENLDSRLPKPPLIEILSLEFCMDPFQSLEPWVLYFLRNYVHLYDFTFHYHDSEQDEELPENPVRNTKEALGDHI